MDYSSPKVLLLGISYPDVKGHMAEHSYDDDILMHSELSVEQAVECVQRKILTEMDGRDLARCVATERAGGGHDVYTVSKEMGGIYRKDRHVYASFNNSRGMRRAMDKAFGKVRFQQVILDYYWMPTGWLVTRWAKTLFQETLPDLVKHNMLAYPGTRPKSPRKVSPQKASPNSNSNNNNKNNNESNNVNNNNHEMALEEGVVFLPFCAHVCKELVGGIHKLKPYFAITFVKKSELPGHALWKGTMSIDGKVMQQRLGKRLDQEEVYCTFQPKDIYESMEDAHVNKDEVMEMLLSIEDFENIRMIRLRPLKQHEPPSVFKTVKPEPETGGFLGLNWAMGRQRFKEYRSRKKNRPLLPTPPPAKKDKKPVVVVHDSDSEVETEPSDVEEDSDIDSDSSSDGDGEHDEDNRSAAAAAEQHSGFDPYHPSNIPPITHYFPYPALDLESYMFSKDIVESDRVMAYYAKQWGPKLSRKKNKKQDLSKQDYQRFQETQRDYLSSNARLPRKPEEGYRWTLVGDGGDTDSENSAEGDGNAEPKGGWELSLKGDDPNEHLVPKIVELAKRDNEMMACQHLFQMKNPGYKRYSRLWINNSSLMTCYQIPKKNVLTKIDMAQQAMAKIARKQNKNAPCPVEQDSEHDCDYDSDNDSVSDSDGSSPPSALCRFADIASSAPVLSEELRLICKASQGLTDVVPEDPVLPPFQPRTLLNELPYDLSPHDDFPRELYRLLQDSQELMFDHLLRWQNEGRSFVVKNHELFEKVVLSRCCQNSEASYRSFRATLLGYNFSTLRFKNGTTEYRHNLFQQRKPKRLDEMISDHADNFLFEKQVASADPPVVQDEPEPTRETSRRKMFVANLYQLLKYSKRYGLSDAIYWEDNGTSFKVHKLKKKFSTIVLKNRLSMNDYSSFKNELFDRGFKCKDGEKYGIFEHPKFVKGQHCESDAFDDICLKWRTRKRKRSQLQPKPEAASALNKQAASTSKKKHKAEPKTPPSPNEETASASKKPSSASKKKHKAGPKTPPSSNKDTASASKIKHKAEPKTPPNPTKETVSASKKQAASASKKKHKAGPKTPPNPKKETPSASKNQVTGASKKKHKAALKTPPNPNETNTKSKKETSKGRGSNSNSNDDKPSSEEGIDENLMYEFTRTHMLPQVIYTILEDAEEKGFSNCIQWSSKGDAFCTHRGSFVKNFLHKYTNIRQLKTFDRLVAWLGFEKKNWVETPGYTYRHRHFIRGRKDKLSLLALTLPRTNYKRSNNVSSKDKYSTAATKSKDVSSKDSSSTKNSIKGIEFPSAAPISRKRKNVELASKPLTKHDKIVRKPNCGDAVIRISSPSSRSEALVVSPLEKKTSNRHLAATSVTISPLDDESATDNCSSITKVSSPGLSTERSLFSPPSVKELKKKSKSSTQSRKNVKSVPVNGVVECNTRLTELPSREIPCNKKRKIDPKARNGVPPPSTPKNRHKPPAKKKKVVSPKPSVSGRNRKSKTNRTRDKSQDRKMARASERGLRSSNKVCGIDPMISTPTWHNLMVSKYRSGIREMTNPIKLSEAARLKARVSEHMSEYNSQSSQALNGSAPETIPLRTPIVTPTLEDLRLVLVDDMVREKLETVSLSKDTLKALASSFESMFGKDRAHSLTMIVLWHAGVPIPAEESVKSLWDCLCLSFDDPLPPRMKWSDELYNLMTMCLLVEAYSFQLSTTHSKNWLKTFSRETQYFSNDSKLEILQSVLHEIGFPNIEMIRIKLMKIVLEDELRLLEKLRTGRNLLQQANDVERRRIQADHRSHHQPANEEERRVMHWEKEPSQAAYGSTQRLEWFYESQKQALGGFPSFEQSRQNKRTALLQNSLPHQQKDDGMPQNFVAATTAQRNYNNNLDVNYMQNINIMPTQMAPQFSNTNRLAGSSSYQTEVEPVAQNIDSLEQMFRITMQTMQYAAEMAAQK